jgi:MscS family membrane protein
MVDTIVDNISLRTQRKTELQLELSLSATAGKLQTLLTAMRRYLSTQNIDSYQVHLHDTGKQAHIVIVEYFSSATDEHEAYLMLREKINMAFIEILEAHKIELAASSTDVVVKQS